MRAGPVRPQIDRTYQSCGPLQYVRELCVNSLEAGATRIEFMPATMTTSMGKLAHRLMIADNGCGMTPEQQEEFLNVHAFGSKAIGDIHGNFGIGFKVSALPWNHTGIVVMSWHPENPDGSLMTLKYDERVGDYGALIRVMEDDEHRGLSSTTMRPYGDYVPLKPPWIQDHGTVVILFGMTGEEHTYFGATPGTRPDSFLLSGYLNKRFWVWPAEVKLSVHEPALSGGALTFVPRLIQGARWFVKSGQLGDSGGLEASGTETLSDGVQIDWYLWEKERPENAKRFSHTNGFIGVLYKSELYDVQTRASTYHTFGIHTANVRKRATLVIRAPLSSAGHPGVFPDDARTMLKLHPHGTALPMVEWATEFANNLPAALQTAEEEAQPKDVDLQLNEKMLERVMARMGGRFNRTILAEDPYGAMKLGGGKPRLSIVKPCPDIPVNPRPEPPNPGLKKKNPLDVHVGGEPGPITATKRSTKCSIPRFKWSTMENVDDSGRQYTAYWSESEFTIRVARDAPVLREVIATHRAGTHASNALVVSQAVEEVYALMMVMAVSHARTFLRSKADGFAGMTEAELNDTLLSPASLTFRMQGLVIEEQYIKNRLRHLGVLPRRIADKAL